MKIGIEASAVFRRQKTGVGYYSYHLTKALIKQMPRDVFLLCYISFITKRPERLDTTTGNIIYRRVSLVPGKIYNFFDHFLVAFPFDILARARADVFIFPNFFRWPLWMCRKSVVVIHDLGFIYTPMYIVPRHRKYLSRRVPESIHRATHVVAVSESTKQQIISNYGIDPGKISVVEPALLLDEYKPAPPEEVEQVKKRYGITKEYLLFLGTIEPRKNIVGILNAYMQLPKAIQEKYQLVLAGGKGWLDDEIDQISARIGGNLLIRTGYVDQSEKPALYTGAKLFLYPSHYEGWGMQILESMACGTPVITARNSSLPEAGGEVAAYVEGNEPAELAQLIQELLRSPDRLAQMRRDGLRRARGFTWDASAKKMAVVLKRVMGGRAG